MRGRPFLRSARLKLWEPDLVRAVLLGVCFLVGGWLGCRCAEALGDPVKDRMAAYLSALCGEDLAKPAAFPMVRCAVLYGGGAVLAFFFGLSPAGVIMIPLLAGAHGFFAMYAATFFAECLGRQGAELACAAMVVRLLFTVPCFLAMAREAWPLSVQLGLLAAGRSRQAQEPLWKGRYFLVFVLCLLILAVGVYCEQLLTPVLLRWAVKGVIL